MGLDEVPEIRKQVEVASREIMREVLIERLVKDVKPDPAAVEKLFRELVREWKTTSLLFQDEKAAQRAQKEIASGAAFDDGRRAGGGRQGRPERTTTMPITPSRTTSPRLPRRSPACGRARSAPSSGSRPGSSS